MRKTKRVAPFRRDEFGDRGQRLYEALKPQLEREHDGEVAALEVESGDYFLADTVAEAIQQGKARHPDKLFYIVRVGRPAVYRVPWV
jgi:hypothetical protein